MFGEDAASENTNTSRKNEKCDDAARGRKSWYFVFYSSGWPCTTAPSFFGNHVFRPLDFVKSQIQWVNNVNYARTFSLHSNWRKVVKMCVCVFVTPVIRAAGISLTTKKRWFGDFATPRRGVPPKVFHQNVSNTKAFCAKRSFNKIPFERSLLRRPSEWNSDFFYTHFGALWLRFWKV